ncbi:hypothetical protein [Streptomyces sp. NPDC006510]|uniref:hypothetical protein n=1 Tax=Streptomyces sp. NPDC006510 TaxID=3155600 RepID=UPI0033A36B45
MSVPGDRRSGENHWRSPVAEGAVSTGPWHEHTNTELREALREQSGPGWHLLADSDEFQQHPAPLADEFAADPDTCRHAFQVAIDFGFVAVDAIGDFLPQKESVAVVQRMGFCDCGCLALDDHDLTRAALTPLASANLVVCQGLLLAATDYAHRTFGCAGLGALIHELAEGRPATFEPPTLTALLGRVRARHTRPRAATPGTAESPTRSTGRAPRPPPCPS